MEENSRQTSKVSLYLGNGKRTTCKISHTQIHNSNVITFDKEVDGGIVIYYKGNEFKFSIPSKAIQYFGFLDKNPIIYCDNKIIMLKIESLLKGEVLTLKGTVEIIEKNITYSRFISSHGKLYLEKWENGNIINYIMVLDEETGLISKEEINKGSFNSVAVKEKAIREFLYNNLVSINNSIESNNK